MTARGHHHHEEDWGGTSVARTVAVLCGMQRASPRVSPDERAESTPKAMQRVMLLVAAIAAVVVVGVGVGVGLWIGLRGSDEPSAATSGTVLAAAVKLMYTLGEFDGERQLKFRRASAVASGATLADVTIKSMAAWPARRAQSGAIRVDFTIAVASQQLGEHLVTTFSQDSLNAALAAEGLKPAELVVLPHIISDAVAAPSSPPPATGPAAPSPPSPSLSRRVAFESFQTCGAVSEACGGVASTGAGELMPAPATDGSFSNVVFPADYCDSCNCSIAKTQDDRVYNTPVGMQESATVTKDAAPAGGAEDFSGTNNQVGGVDEADTVKTDGSFVYMLPKGYGESHKLVISRAFPPSSAHLVSTTDLTPYALTPRALLLEGDVLVVIGSSSDSLALTGTTTSWIGTVVAQLWDVSDKSAPRLNKSVQLEGSKLAARMVDGRVYLVVRTYPRWLGQGRAKYLRSASPLARELNATVADSVARRASVPFRAVEPICTKIGHLKGVRDVAEGFITVLALDADKERKDSYGKWTVSTHAGRGSTVFVSSKHIYVAATTYDYRRAEPATVAADCGEAGKALCPSEDPKPARGVWSAILKFDMNHGAPSFSGIGEVDGSILNQFAMDEFNGYLRIASTKGQMWARPTTSESLVTILAQNLTVVAVLDGLARGERIYSARFMGERGYVVTYRQTDPFFVFDLSVPTAPRMLGYLKVPGFSDYLHPLDTTSTRMLGVGKDTVETTPEKGGVIVYTRGVKLSLFNVTDPTQPRQEDVLLLGDRYSSTAVSFDHKAFLFHAGSGIISLPLELWQSENCDEARTLGGACPHCIDFKCKVDKTFQGVYVIDLVGETAENKKFRVRGRVTHERVAGASDIAADTGRVMLGIWGAWRESLRRVHRSIYMDGSLYTLSDRHMQVCRVPNKMTASGSWCMHCNACASAASRCWLMVH